METLDEITRRVRASLEAAGISTPALDARLIVQRGANKTEADMISGGRTPLSNQHVETIDKFLKARLEGIPVSRLWGEREFWGMIFRLSPDTLDPRPDTETLVAAALKRAGLQMAGANNRGAAQKHSLRILDLGTGTGCILIALLKELPYATGVGIDLSHGALMTARENAEALGVGARVAFRLGSWFEPLETGESFGLIVSNPPYIPDSEIESLAVEVREHDPRLALTGGRNGLDAYKNILESLRNHLMCGGHALFEIGRGQENDLARLAGDAGMQVVESYTDLAGIVRVVEITHGEK